MGSTDGGHSAGTHSAGDHIDFHHNDIGKAVGVENNYYYSSPPPPEPGQIVEGDIPQCPPGFQRREQLLQRLAELLGDPSPGQDGEAGGTGGRHSGAAVVCSLGGTPGVGKTMLAASYAWACQAARWPVVAWIAAETTVQILTGLAALAERLGQRRPEDDAATAAARAKAWLAATERPALLVFDNATDVATVRAWCPATGATRVVITTRNRAFLRVWEPVEVEVFTIAQATAFLHRRTRLDDPAGAAELTAELGYLPLAVAQAAAVITRLRLDYAGYLELLRAFPIGDYLPAQDGADSPAGTAEAILLSVTQAETALHFARDLLGILAVLSPAGIPLPVLHAWTPADTEPVHVRDMLADLADTSLITFSEDGTTILMHRLIQRVLRDRAAHHGDLDTLLEHATDLLHAFNATLPDGARTWAARAAVEMLIEQTDTLYQQAGDNGLSADLLDLRAWCGRFLYELADFTRAIPLLQQTLTHRERVLGADHPDTLTSRNNLAVAYRSVGDLGRAIPLYKATLTERERVLGADHPFTLASRNALAHAYHVAGDLSRAIPLHEATLTEQERVLGGDHPSTLMSRNNLASAYQAAGDLSRAIPLLEATLAEQERVLGGDHPDTLTSHNNLAGAYQAAGDLGRAILLYKATLAERERVLGVDHPSTFTSRSNLAGAYQAAGDLSRAIPLHEATLTEQERVLGVDHPDTLASRNYLASAYQAAGDLGRAIPLLEASLTDCERVLGGDHPDTLTSRNNLAGAYQAAGDLGRAIPLHERTLTERKRVLGVDHPDTLTSHNNLATAYQATGDLGRAIQLYEATLTACERVLSSGHPTTRIVRENLEVAVSQAAPRRARRWRRLFRWRGRATI